MPGVAMAQGAAIAPGAEPNWRVNCDGEGEARRCTLLQNLVSSQGDARQRLLTVLVQPGEDGEPALLLALPHGLFLPAGAQIQVDDGQARKLVIQTADQNGSYAGLPIDDELLASLRLGSTLEVTVESAQRQAITVPVTLIGFSRAYEDYLTRTATP